MAKKKKTTRKELLRAEDEFLTLAERIIRFFRDNIRLLIYMGVGLALATAFYVGVEIYLGHVNRQGQAAYNAAYYQVRKAFESKEVLKELRQTQEAFSKVIENYGWAKSARLAMPQIAFTEYLSHDYNQAISYYTKFLHKVSGERSSTYKDLARLALASSYESKGELEKAINTLNLVLKGPTSPFEEFALFGLCRTYRLHGEVEKAKQTLKKFIEEHKDSPFIPLAEATL